MKLEWRSFLSLKIPVLIAFFLLWNAGFLLAMKLGGGGLTGALTSTGMKVTGLVCTAACLFALAVASSKSLQSLVVAPSRTSNFSPKEFYFLALITGVLAVTRFIFPLLMANQNAL